MYDLLVVGGGPAGGSAALHAAQYGLKVALLEEHAKIGEPVHCGECLSDFALNDLKWNLPSEAVSRHVKGVRVIFPNESDSLLTEPGVVLEKHKFEQWIASKAQDAGAEIMLSTKVVKAEKQENAWTVKTKNKDFQAKIIVDASGVASFLSRQLNLNNHYESVIGIQYEMGEIPSDGYLDFYLWPELAPKGYLWMIPKNNGRANVGLVTSQNNKAKMFLDEFVKRKNWQSNKIAKTFGGLIPSSGALENTVADGIILVGDAAGFTSPLFEGGTHLSIKSGSFAAQVAKKAIDANNTTKNSLAEYETLWKKEFPPYNELLKGKNALYSLTEEELNEMASLMPKELSSMSVATKAGVGLQLLSKPRLLQKGVMNAFKAFGYSKAEHYGW